MGVLTDLGNQIAALAASLEKELKQRGLPQPSFECSAADEFPLPADDFLGQEIRHQLLDDTKVLTNLLLGPAELIRRVCCTPFEVAAQQVIYEYKIYDAVPLEGSISYAEVAAKVGLPEHRVRSVIRHSILNNIFAEPTANQVTHTAASAVLCRSDAMRDWYGHFVDEVFPASTKVAETLKKFPGSQEPQDCAFSTAFGTREPIFRFLEEHPARQARFFGAMAGVGKNPGYALEHVINGFEWTSIQPGSLVVDVGGSSGFLSVALAKASPSLSFLVQDYEHTIQKGREQLPEELKDRVKFQAHDFFSQQPVHANVYILRHILHDWSDANAVRILKMLLPVLESTGRILLVETVLQPPGTFHHSQERQQRNMEMTMFQMLNAKERTRAEWEAVVATADDKLSIIDIKQPAGSWDSVIEIGWVQ